MAKYASVPILAPSNKPAMGAEMSLMEPTVMEFEVTPGSEVAVAAAPAVPALRSNTPAPDRQGEAGGEHAATLRLQPSSDPCGSIGPARVPGAAPDRAVLAVPHCHPFS